MNTSSNTSKLKWAPPKIHSYWCALNIQESLRLDYPWVIYTTTTTTMTTTTSRATSKRPGTSRLFFFFFSLWSKDLRLYFAFRLVYTVFIQAKIRSSCSTHISPQFFFYSFSFLLYVSFFFFLFFSSLNCVFQIFSKRRFISNKPEKSWNKIQSKNKFI